jgi:hypothetical protein
MWRAEYLRDHVEALMRLSRAAKEPELAAKLQEMADEVRIMISVAAVAELAAVEPSHLRAKLALQGSSEAAPSEAA